MNMQSLLIANTASDDGEDTVRLRLRRALYRFRYFIALVIAPTLLITAYLYLIAADQYQSEAHFIVSASDARGVGASGLGTLLGLGGASPSESQMLSVPDYLRSHDAVAVLSKRVPITAMFQRPEADALSRLRKADPKPEDLLRYYRGKVSIVTDHDSGINTLTVRAFRPEDAYGIAEALLAIGEQQVNAMNRRSYNDAVAIAQQQLRTAENESAEVQQQMTGLRQSSRDVDPMTTGQVQIKLVADLRARLAAANSQLSTMRALISPSSPQYVALAHQVRSLESQLGAQSARLSGGGATIATNLGDYEALRVRQDFAAKRYDAAAASLAKAREDALRQQLYLVRIVDANLPVKALYPERAKIILTMLIALAVAYGIGWLILAGVREHAA